MLRLATGFLLILCGTATHALAKEVEPPRPSRGGITVHAPSPDDGLPLAAWRNHRNLTYHGRLRHDLPGRRLEAEPLGSVVRWLGLASGAKLHVNWTALESVGVTSDTPVTLNLPAMPFGKTIERLLDVAAGAEGKLKYRVERAEIIISSAEDIALAGDVLTRVYDIRDLVRPNGNEDDAELARRTETLTKLVTGSIDPTTWRDAGGTLGSVRELHGNLIVTQTAANHRAIINLLEQTRALLGLPPLPPPPTPPAKPDPTRPPGQRANPDYEPAFRAKF